MSSLKTLNKLPSTGAFSAAEKWTVRSTGVIQKLALFLLKTETWDAKNSWEFFVDAIFCLVKIGFEKRRTNRKSSLMNGKSLILPRIYSIKFFFLYCETILAVGFWLLSFLQLFMKLWGRIIPLQIRHSPGAASFPLFVRQRSQMC